MKRILFFLFTMLSLTGGAFAQYNPYTPDPGVNIGPYPYSRVGPIGQTGNDNTYRVMTYNYVKWDTVAAYADTVFVVPGAYNNVYTLNVGTSDSAMIEVSSLSYSYAGDEIIVVAQGTSGNVIKFEPGKLQAVIPTGVRYILGTNGRAIVKLFFDGIEWVVTGSIVE